jgi:uncharacterized protein with HEPN domain
MAQDNVRNNAALLDMITAIRRIQKFIAATAYAEYEDNDLLRSAVERQLEILGEAANRITPAFQLEHSEIDWRNTIGLRNVIIHQYDRIDDHQVWTIVTKILPELLPQVEALIPPLPEES